MRKILLVLFCFLCHLLIGQNIQLKIEDINFDFVKDKILDDSCLDNSLIEFMPFSDKKQNFSVHIPSVEEVYNFPTEEEGEGSTIFQLKWDKKPLIITITEYPYAGITLKELFFKEYISISNLIGKKYDIGIESINNKEVYWIKELVPDSEFGAYSTLFFLFNEKKEKIYMFDFSTFDKQNCKVNGLIIKVLNSVVWKNG